jgi:hypothetical protein
MTRTCCGPCSARAPAPRLASPPRRPPSGANAPSCTTPVGYAVEKRLLGANPIDRIQWKAPDVAETVDRRVVASPAQARALLAGVRAQGPRGQHLEAFFGCRSRVDSYDWLISLVVMPAGYALAGPLAARAGDAATLIGAALLLAIPCTLVVALPGIRAVRRNPGGHITGPPPRGQPPLITLPSEDG